MKLYFQDRLVSQERWSDWQYGDAWIGYSIAVETDSTEKAPLHLSSTAGMKCRLSLHDTVLFWAQIADDFYNVAVYRPLPPHIDIIPSITSAHIQAQKPLQTVELRQRYWATHFLEALRDSPNTCFYAGLWRMEYHQANHPYSQRDARQDPMWMSRCRTNRWDTFKAEDDWAFLQAHFVEINWAMCGNGNAINLFAPSQLPEESGRIKWWRKVIREEISENESQIKTHHKAETLRLLPPILVWAINSLDAYVILDGHDRLQACILEKQAPDFLVINSYTEQNWACDPKQQDAIFHQLNLVEKRMVEGIDIKPEVIDGIQRALVSAFDDRPMVRAVTRSRANMKAAEWDKQVNAFIKPHIKAANGALPWFVLSD
jgi:hypothetical protein